MIFREIIVFHALFCCVCYAPPDPVDNIEATLIETLIKQYPGNGLARPMTDFDMPFLTVNLSMIISDFDDLDDVTGLLSLSGRLMADWVDQNLHWNPIEYKGIDKVQLRASTIWLPPVIQYNYAPDLAVPLFSGGGSDSLATIWARSDGGVTAIHSGALITKCTIDLTRFPFDEQECSYLYTTYAYPEDALHFAPGIISFVATPDPSGVWSIGEYRCENAIVENDPADSDQLVFSGVQCTFQLLRRSNWFLINFFAPCLLLAFLQLSTFLMPLGEGRAAFCITVVLAFAVFQTIASTLLPKTSSNIPLVTYLIVQMSVGTVATVAAIYLYFFYERGKEGDRKVWGCFSCILRLYGTHGDDKDRMDDKMALEELLNSAAGNNKTVNDILRKSEKGSDSDSSDSGTKNKPPNGDIITGVRMKRVYFRKMSQLLQLKARRQLRQMVHDRREEQWKSVANFFDTTIGILCLLVTITSTVLFFWPIYNSGSLYK